MIFPYFALVPFKVKKLEVAWGLHKKVFPFPALNKQKKMTSERGELNAVGLN